MAEERPADPRICKLTHASAILLPLENGLWIAEARRKRRGEERDPNLRARAFRFHLISHAATICGESRLFNEAIVVRLRSMRIVCYYVLRLRLDAECAPTAAEATACKSRLRQIGKL